GESESDLGGTLAYSYGGYEPGSPVGDYAITPSGLTSSNYDIVFKAGTLKVGKRAVTLEWPDPSTFTYNGAQRTYGPPTVGNLYTGDEVTAVCASGTDTAKDAGSYVAMVESLSGAKAANYELPTDTAQLHHAWSITPAALTVKAKDSEITYGDAPAGKGVTYDKLLGSDTEALLSGTLAYTYTYAQYGGVGEYALTPSGLSSQNYAISYEAGKLTVVPREVTLSWPTPDSFDYTGAELTYGRPTLGNLVNADDVSIGAYEGNKATESGTHTAEVTSLAGAKAANYKLPDDATHDWTIVGADNEATVTMEGWTYGDAANAPVVTAKFGKDAATFAYYTDKDLTQPVAADALDADGVPKLAGDYWVKATIPAAGSYAGAEASASFTIAKRPATVTAKLQVVEVGASVAAGADQAELSGAAAGDALSAVTLTATSTAAPTEAGTITPSAAVVKDAAGADMTANYEITYVPAKLIVAPAVTIANGKAIYAMHKDIWLTVDEATAVIAADRDAQLIDLADAHALLLATGEELGVIVKDDGGFVAVVGDYEMTMKANPELGVTAHVRDSKAADPDTGVTVYANDTAPDADTVKKASASPSTGDSTWPWQAFAISAVLAAAMALFAHRRIALANRGKHVR
ncbi:MAG: hypothetical protein IJ111_08880, partial [Eggerthellaceae bacterium]|nr:hypothetical protein [Eggerthellaceae bacterium]